jgi:signal transduction histidine kinase
MQLSIVDPQPLLDEIQSLSPQIPKNALTIKAPLHPVRANAVLLQQCLSNLLDNARKFVLPGVEPRITIWTEPAPVGPSSQSAGIARAAFNPAAIPSPSGAVGEGRNPSGAAGHNTRRIRIWVQDNGIGVAPESREKIFGIFERLHLPEKYEGTGIGLAIVARAIQRMNGSCGVEPGVDQGSRFWLELPAAE